MRKQHSINPELFLHPYLFDSIELGKDLSFFDKNAYANYRQSLILKALSGVVFRGQEVLHVGVQNPEIFRFIALQKPAELYGLGLFPPLLEATQEILGDFPATLTAFDGKNVTFPPGSFDITVTTDFLQHYTESKIMKKVLYGIGQSARDYLVFIEDTAEDYLKTPFYRAREVDFFVAHFEKRGYELIQNELYPTRATDYFRQYLRDKYNPPQGRVEGAPLSKKAQEIERKYLKYVQKLDAFAGGKNGLTKLVFKKSKEEIEVF